MLSKLNSDAADNTSQHRKPEFVKGHFITSFLAGLTFDGGCGNILIISCCLDGHNEEGLVLSPVKFELRAGCNGG